MSKIIQFLREVAIEFRHITWPKKDALIQLTFVVISVSLIISALLGGFDLLFTRSIPLLDQLKNQPQNVEVLPSPTTENITPVITLNPEPTK